MARKVIVGAALAPGEYPSAALVTGQVVQVIGVSGETSFGDDEGSYEVLGTASVVSVKALSRTDELLVTMRVEQRLAPLMSERAQQRRIRLAIVEDPDDGAFSTLSPPTSRATSATPTPALPTTPSTPFPSTATPTTSSPSSTTSLPAR